MSHPTDGICTACKQRIARCRHHYLILSIYYIHSVCLYYHEWHRVKSVKQGAGSRLDEEKQLFGLIWTLRNLAAAINPTDGQRPKLGTPMKIGEGCSFQSFRTNVYRSHFLESASGLKFVLNTSPDVDSTSMQDVLKVIYSEVYVNCVVKNPLYHPMSKFNFDNVTEQLNTHMRNRGLIN